MTKRHLRLGSALAVALTATAAGCSDSGNSKSTSTSGGGGSGVQTSAGNSTTGGVQVDCNSAAACGGDAVGTWNVVSSCLELSGDMDVTLASLGCPTVPVTGSLETTGSLVLNDDGSYTDNTTTTGSVTFPLQAACLTVSSVDVECGRVANLFIAMGWSSSECTDTSGQCECSLSTEQQGGLGAVVPYTEPAGFYTTMDTSLTATNVTYGYCASGDTLTLTPDMSGLTGSVVLAREGTASVTSTAASMGGASSSTNSANSTNSVSSMGGASNTMGGTSSTMGGASSTMGGASSTMGGASSTSDGGDGGTSGAGGSGGNPATGTGPCDIYQAAGTPCVAAHSTVRALFGSYDGSLYQVRRADGMTQDIPVSSPGGFADSSVQDSFCSGSTCTMWRLYDQTGNGNFLEAQTPDSTVGGNSGMTAANAAAEQVTVGGHQVYSLFTRPSQAYWNDGSQTGMPKGAEPQGIYMVTSGEHFNGGCCYNYGNGQTDRVYMSGTRMDSIYFGNSTQWGTGAGNGPWVMADMENGMLSGGTNGAQNPNNTSLPFTFVTAMEKNNGSDFALKGADATQATLTTMWDGPLPGSRLPVAKEGAVILGAGGDCCYSNNNLSEGTFYEGAIVSGYPSDETDNAIHANVVEAGYGQ